MYKTSTAFNRAIKNGERIYVKVKCGNFIFGYDDETDPTSPNEQNNIMELNIDRSISHDDYALAKSYACGCNCVLWAVPAGAVLRGQKTVVYFGCMVNGAVEWVPMGVFYPEKVTRSGECTTLEMYDHMYDLSMPYSAAISGQQTPLAILKDLARQGNFELAAGVESKVSGFGTVDVSLLCGTETDEDGKQQVTAYNVNDAIGYVAGFCGCAAVFDREGKLRVDTFAQVYDGTAEYTVTDDTVTEVSLAETDKTYLGISCNNGNKNILAPESLSVGSEVLYFDNPLITTQAQAEKVFNAVSDMIYIDDGDQGETVFDLGIQYRPGSMTLLTANPALDSFDVITYRDDTGDHHIPLMGVEYDYDGSVTMDVAAHARSEQESSSAGSILSRMISKAMQQVTAPLAQRIQDATDSITNAVGGYAALIDRDGDGVSDALYIGEYPAAEGKTKGRCLLLNKNGMAVSTTGLQGPFKDFAVYYNKKTNQYYLNATDISAGRLSGIEILVDKGRVGNWIIDNATLTEQGGLFADYVPEKDGTAYRVFLQPAFKSDSNPKPENTWVISVQKADVLNYGTGTYSYTFRVLANGCVDVGGTLSVKQDATFSSNVTLGGKLNAPSEREIINTASGGNNLVIGFGQYDLGLKTYLEGNDIYLRMQQYGSLYIQMGPKDNVETRFKLSKSQWTINGDTAYRDTITSAGGFMIDANSGKNGLYLNAKSTWIYNAATITGNLTVRGDVTLNFKSSSGTMPLVVNTRGVITTANSSKRYKENIKPVEDAVLDPNGLYDVQVCQYNYKPEYKDNELVSGTQIGVIAEDLDKHYPNAVIYDSEGRPESWQDRIMIPAMLKLIQDQKKQLDALQAEVDALKAKLQ